jgi:hypothetical protein
MVKKKVGVDHTSFMKPPAGTSRDEAPACREPVTGAAC